MKVYGSTQLKEDVFGRNLCIGCGACISLCPYFKTYRGRTAMLFPCTQESGRCHAYCPKAEVDLDEVSSFTHGEPYRGSGIGPYRDIARSMAGKKTAGTKFQSGGTVTAIVQSLFERGMIDAAILTGSEGLLPVPRIVTGKNGAAACAGSKYAAAPTLAALNEAREKGFRRICLVATPCQSLAAALIRLHEKNNGREDPIALTIGLFCTWALDYRSIAPILEKEVNISDIEKIDIPPPPAEVLRVFTVKGVVEIPLREVRPHIPAACGYCVDMTAEFADISVGVLEGSRGWNTLISRTERGREAVFDTVKEGYLRTEEFPPESLAGLITAATNKRTRAFRKAVDEGMVNTPEGGRRSCLRLAETTLGKILG